MPNATPREESAEWAMWRSAWSEAQRDERRRMTEERER